MKSAFVAARGFLAGVSSLTTDLSRSAMTAALAVLFYGSSLFAAGTWVTDSWTGGFTPADDNLILGRVPSHSGWAYASEGAGNPAVLTDGAATPNTKPGSQTLNNYSVLTWNFDSLVNVREIRIYSTWGDDGRDQLSVSSVTAVSATNDTVITLSPSACQYDAGSGDKNANRARLVPDSGNSLAGAVESVTIQFGVQENSYAGYAEIEIVGTVDTETPMLFIDGAPAQYGSPSPGYGTMAMASRTLSAPAAWTNDAGTVRWRCTGWKIYCLTPSGDWVFDGSIPNAQGTGTSFLFTPVSGIGTYKVVWQWTPQYAVSITAGAGGAVSGAGFYEGGSVVTVSATPADPSGYAIWSGDLPFGMAPNARSFTFSIEGPVALAASFADVVWVDDDAAAGGDGTAAAPFQTVDAAISAAPPSGVIVVKAGSYQLASAHTLGSAITIQGETGDFRDVTIASDGSQRRTFTLASASATLRGLTLRGTRYSQNGVVALTAGLLENCRVTGGCCARQGGGAGVYNEGGIVRRCTIDGCTASGNIYDGLGLYQSSGTTEYCFITNNSYSACHGAMKHPCPAGAFLSGGVLRGTLIAFNSPGTVTEDLSACYNGFALHLRNSPVVDGCAIVENTINTTIGALPTAAIYSENEARIYNTIVLNNTDPSGADLAITGVKKVNYSLLSSAAGISGTGNQFEASGTYVWSDTGEFALQPLSGAVGNASPMPDASYVFDLYGRPRVNGGAMDIGPAECSASVSGASAVIRTPSSNFLLPYTSVFTVAYAGFPSGGVRYVWSIDDEPISTAAVLTNAWEQAGVYVVSVSVTDENGMASATDTLEITAISKDIYLDASCATPTYPYGTPATAATRFADIAAMLVPGGSLTARPGTYSVADEISLSFPYEIRGDGNRDDIVFARSGSGRLISLTDSQAHVHGLTFRGGYASHGGTMHISGGALAEDVNLFGGETTRAILGDTGGGGCLYIASGTIRNATIGNVATGNDINYGIGVHMESGALVECCIITNIVATQLHYASDHAQGVAVHMRGGTLRNCLIANNRIKDGITGTQGVNAGMYAAGLFQRGGRVENCTIADNTSAVGPAGYYDGGGNMTNTIVYANTSANGNAGANVAGAGSSDMGFCCVGDPGFNREARKSRPYYAISSGSPCENAGIALDWMDEESVDLAMASRLVGGRPDIGCYEIQAPLGTMIIMR